MNVNSEATKLMKRIAAFVFTSLVVTPGMTAAAFLNYGPNPRREKQSGTMKPSIRGVATARRCFRRKSGAEQRRQAVCGDSKRTLGRSLASSFVPVVNYLAAALTASTKYQ